MKGFDFESNRGTRVNIAAETALGSQFNFPWNDRKGRKFRSRTEATQQKLRTLARELQAKFFSAAQESTRLVVAELRAILSSVEAACQAHDHGSVSLTLLPPQSHPSPPPPQELESGLLWQEELSCSLKALADLLRDEKTISAYEVHASRLVPILLHCLDGGRDQGRGRARIAIFKAAFVEALPEQPLDHDTRWGADSIWCTPVRG